MPSTSKLDRFWSLLDEAFHELVLQACSPEPDLVELSAYRRREEMSQWVFARSKSMRFAIFVFRPIAELSRIPSDSTVTGSTVDFPILALGLSSYFEVRVRRDLLSDENNQQNCIKYLTQLANVSENIYEAFEKRPQTKTEACNRFSDRYLSLSRDRDFSCALNPTCNPETLQLLCQSSDALVLKTIACREQLSPLLQELLLKNKNSNLAVLRIISRRSDLTKESETILHGVDDPTINDYITCPRKMECIAEPNEIIHCDSIIQYFRYLLGDSSVPRITQANKKYLNYFESHDGLSRQEIMKSLESQGVGTKNLMRAVKLLLPPQVDRFCLENAKQRLTSSVKYQQELSPFAIKGFTFAVDYDLAWPIRGGRSDLNFNVSLQLDAKLYYPERVDLDAIAESRWNTYFHLRDSIGWCCGIEAEEAGKKTVYLVELQSDLHQIAIPTISNYFRDWSQMLLYVVFSICRSRNIDRVCLVTANAVRRMNKTSHDQTRQYAWDKIYDGNAVRFGMKLGDVATAVNIHTLHGKAFFWQHFYMLELNEMLPKK